MIRLDPRPLWAFLCTGTLAGAAFSYTPVQGFAGPFEAGQRWVHAADLLTPWIPTQVSFAAKGELVWVATDGGSTRLLLLDGSRSGVVQPAYTDGSVGGATNLLGVAGAGAEHLLTLAQYPAPDSFHRSTVVTRHDALLAGVGGPFAAAWTHDMGLSSNGPALMEVGDGAARVLVAGVQDSSSQVRVELLDGDTGAPLLVTALPGSALESLALSGDGSLMAIGIGARVVVLDEAGVAVHDEVLTSTIGDLALDADGARLVVGGVGELRVYDRVGTTFQLAANHGGGSDELASLVELSADGETYAVAWWRFHNPDALRCEVYAGPAHELVNQLVQVGQSGGLQNAPSGLAMTADGRRIAFSSWGQGNGAPEVVLLERGVAQPVLEIDLPGSALGLDLDPTGRRIAVVTKNLHANQVGSTGEVRMYDSGERDLELEAPARLGGTLEASSKQAGSSLAFFLAGTRAAVPSRVPGVQGSLMLDRALRLRVFPRPANQGGVAELELALPADPVLSGLQISLQVANRVAGTLILSETVLDPLYY
jgi:hypothetical protein